MPQTLTAVTTAIMTTAIGLSRPCGDRNDFGKVAREGVRERGDRAAGDDEKQRPAVEERGDAPESVANEAVEPAGFGIGGGEFGVGERAEE